MPDGELGFQRVGRHHADVVLRSATIICDGKVMQRGAWLNPELGFEPMA